MILGVEVFFSFNKIGMIGGVLFQRIWIISLWVWASKTSCRRGSLLSHVDSKNSPVHSSNDARSF